MTAVDEVNSSLASKYMDFCQALASQGQAFNFSIVIGPSFSFSLDTRSKVMQESGTKKRASPLTLRRNAKRREEFAKKQNSSVWTTTEDDTATSNSLTCDQCDAAFKTRNGLKIHKGKSHKETTKSPEKLREASSPGSPVKEKQQNSALQVLRGGLQL